MRNGLDIFIDAGMKRADIASKGPEKAGNGRDRKNEYLKVAREMESLFAYQLLKIMRQASDGISAEKKGMGYNTYMSMFDMEISRMMSERGMGLQDAIVQWLERTPGARSVEENK
jgi:Rod binding domain-containing protein